MKDKTILVTGASSGFGYAIAEKFLKAGAKVILVGRRKEKMQKLAAKFKNKSLVIQLDVQKKSEVSTAVKNLPPSFKNIDLLVNNAGLALGLEAADQARLDDWETMIDTNIKGVIYFTKAVLPLMVKRKKGHIINMGSIAGTYPYPGGNVYGASKSFLKQFSLNLRADLLGKGIRITNIEPGMAETEFSLIRYKGDKKRAGDLYKNMKPLTAKDISEMVFWCFSQPKHVNINRLEVMPTEQAFSAFSVHRN